MRNGRRRGEAADMGRRRMSYELLRPDIWECIRRGGGYCPCAIIKDEESRCICKEFREGQETNCHCGVWRKHDDRAEDTNVPRKERQVAGCDGA